MSSFYQLGWELYFYIDNLNHSQADILLLDKEIIDKCQLNRAPRTRIYLKNFIDNIDLILNKTERKIIKEKITQVKDFFSNNNVQKETIEKLDKNSQDDILLIYRFRNKIVHNAHYDNRILPYYVEKARNYAGEFLQYVINQYKDNPKKNIEEIVLQPYLEMNILLEKISKNEKIDLFEE